jgi:hypothetical protein
MSSDRAPLGDLEIGLSIQQAAAIVQEFDALWRASSWCGRKHVKELLKLRDTLAIEMRTR